MLAVIAVYRAVVSPWLGSRCRFEPSCSAYAAEAVARHGPWVGLRLAATRVARCHPWGAGGYDPVPDATTDVAAADDSKRSQERRATSRGRPCTTHSPRG